MHLINLSAGGCLVATRGAVVSTGAEVTVYAKLGGIEVPLAGRVAHAKSGWGFAVEFVNLAKEARQHLEQFLTQALSTS